MMGGLGRMAPYNLETSIAVATCRRPMGVGAWDFSRSPADPPLLSVGPQALRS